MMKLLSSIFAATLLAWAFASCSSGSGAATTFCDTACVRDSIKYVREDHPLKPFVYLSAANCTVDSLAWSYLDMGKRKLAMSTLFGSSMKLNENAMDCYIRDTSYAWLMFNNCATGRGYLAKIPFNNREAISTKTSAVNRFDPKYDVDKSLLAYCDRGNIFVEELATGKTAMMTFGERIEINYDEIHNFIDSVKITPTSIWTKVKINNQWKELKKEIVLK